MKLPKCSADLPRQLLKIIGSFCNDVIANISTFLRQGLENWNILVTIEDLHNFKSAPCLVCVTKNVFILGSQEVLTKGPS